MKHFKQTSWIFLALLCLSFIQANTWELKKDKDGIKVYTRSVEGVALDAFKGVGKVNAPLPQVLAVLRDGNNYTEWFPDCSVSIQKENTEKRQVNYTVTDAPFPVTDRDSYVELLFLKKANGAVQINLKGLPNYAPKDDDRIRVTFIEGYWLLEPEGNQTLVTYELQANPGGSIPAWLANATAVDQPFGSIKGLREMVE